LHSRVYHDTTLALVAESAHGLVFDNFYAHIGRSSNSLVAILLSIYPKLDFRDITTSIGTCPARRCDRSEDGYRTAFITPSDMSWPVGRRLEGRGFRHSRRSPTVLHAPLVLGRRRSVHVRRPSYIAEEPTRPFFIMGWTQQTTIPTSRRQACRCSTSCASRSPTNMT
jgi:hypothetical protein